MINLECSKIYLNFVATIRQIKKMKRLFSVIALAMGLSALGIHAENYPYRSDYLWVTAPNHADWLYETGEKATVEVQFFKYGIPQEGTVNYAVGNDMLPDDEQGSVELKNGISTTLISSILRHFTPLRSSSEMRFAGRLVTSMRMVFFPAFSASMQSSTKGTDQAQPMYSPLI